jgi:hypothetical protein
MTEETALKLVSALNRFGDCLDRLSGRSLGGGLNVYHYGLNEWQRQHPQPNYYGPAVAMPRIGTFS